MTAFIYRWWQKKTKINRGIRIIVKWYGSYAYIVITNCICIALHFAYFSSSLPNHPPPLSYFLSRHISISSHLISNISSALQWHRCHRWLRALPAPKFRRNVEIISVNKSEQNKSCKRQKNELIDDAGIAWRQLDEIAWWFHFAAMFVVI